MTQIQEKHSLEAFDIIEDNSESELENRTEEFVSNQATLLDFLMQQWAGFNQPCNY